MSKIRQKLFKKSRIYPKLKVKSPKTSNFRQIHLPENRPKKAWSNYSACVKDVKFLNFRWQLLISSNFVQCVTNQVWRICKMQTCLCLLVSIFPHENSCRIITHSLPDSSSPLDSTLFVIVFCAYKTGYFSNTCSFYYLSVSKYTFYSCLIVFNGFALFQLCNK